MKVIREIAAHETASMSHSDPIEDFFRGITTAVKTLPPHLQLQAKRSISNVVFDLEQQDHLTKPTHQIWYHRHLLHCLQSHGNFHQVQSTAIHKLLHTSIQKN